MELPGASMNDGHKGHHVVQHIVGAQGLLAAEAVTAICPQISCSPSRI